MTLESQMRRFGRDDGEVRAMLDTYREYQNGIHDDLLRPFPDAPETVAELERRGYGLAIVTSKHRRATLRGMELCGLVRHFDVIVTPEDVAEPKPHPEPVLLALESWAWRRTRRCSWAIRRTTWPRAAPPAPAPPPRSGALSPARRWRTRGRTPFSAPSATCSACSTAAWQSPEPLAVAACAAATR
jgi:hypothetical protein